MKKIKRYNKPGEWKELVSYGKVDEEKEWVGIVDARGGGEYKLRVVAEHKARNTRGKVVVRAVAGEGAQVELMGIIRIEKQAQGTDDFLELRVLLLDEKSRANVDPQLEIEANEVRAGHAASVSNINEQQVEYLQSRGLGRRRAEEEIVRGWLEGEVE